MHINNKKNAIFFLILLFNFDIVADDINERPIKSAIQRKLPHRRSIVSLIFSNVTALKNVPANKTATCRWLRGYKQQNKLCRKRKGFPEALIQARQLAVRNCEEQFRFDRWNCSVKKSVFKKIFRETAFLYAISSSAMMYSIAKACSTGSLENCKCGASVESEEGPNWKWGGCGDNTKQAKKITRKFLQLKQNGDGPHNVLNYNSLVGMRIVAESEMRACKCHGVSASCVMKTCWKSLHSFSHISEKLKASYHYAIQHLPKNTIEQTIKNINRNPARLLYLAQSPTFCHTTTGRRCKDIENCATLCCGRGFDTGQMTVYRRCNCRWLKCCYDLACQTCSYVEEIFTCK